MTFVAMKARNDRPPYFSMGFWILLPFFLTWSIPEFDDYLKWGPCFTFIFTTPSAANVHPSPSCAKQENPLAFYIVNYDFSVHLVF